MVQRPHYFAIVDEVDSVLIDEARTPLIISGPVGRDTSTPFKQYNPQVQSLHKKQLRITNELVVITSYSIHYTKLYELMPSSFAAWVMLPCVSLSAAST